MAIQILSTALLPQSLVNKAHEAGIQIDTVPFIKTIAIDDEGLNKKIAALFSQKRTVVFTSANAVSAVAAQVKNAAPDWSVYCIGHATAEAVKRAWRNAVISGKANDAAGLAALIMAQQTENIIFFCGDKRMDTLPATLQNAGVAVSEIVVYQTIEELHVIDKQYDGILFYSPSGVDSFFSVNQIPDNTVLFAIGNTTACAVKNKVNNKLLIASVPAKEQVVYDATQYFNHLSPVFS